METPNNFHVHLPSNVVATSPLQVGNTITNYVTRLPYKRNFSDEWEVALAQISYTKSWYNVMKDQKLKLVTTNGRTNLEIDEQLRKGNYDKAEDLVSSINRIYEDYAWINPSLKIYLPPKLFYEPQSHKIKIRLGFIDDGNSGQDLLYPRFSQFLADMLGLTDSQGRQYPQASLRTIPTREYTGNVTTNPFIPYLTTAQPGTTTTEPVVTNFESKLAANPAPGAQTTETPPNTRDAVTRKLIIKSDVKSSAPDVLNMATSLVTGHKPRIKRTDVENPFRETNFVNGFREVVLNPITSLYIYCYIIKPVNVGNVEAPLLRRVEIPNNILFGETVELEYSNLQYHPLVSDEIDSIEFDIRDDTNRPIECAFGRTVPTLHFREKPKNVFSAFNFR